MKCFAHSIEYCQTCWAYQQPKPFSASFEGYTANPDDLEQWPNTVTVEAVEHWSIGQRGEVEEPIEKYADFGDVRQLVEIDTNYKPGRPGQHPVRLTRADAMKFAAAVLRATGDTFHYSRCGQLRPAEAAELLQALREIEVELDEIREHALADLLDGTGLGDDQPDEPAPAPSDGPAEEAAAAASVASEPQAQSPVPIPAWRETLPSGTTGFDEQFAAALRDAFPDAVAAFTDSDAFGALNFKVHRRCQQTSETPLQVLSSIDPNDRTFALTADDPAAFLASRIES
jgi:hypothetical protein